MRNSKPPSKQPTTCAEREAVGLPHAYPWVARKVPDNTRCGVCGQFGQYPGFMVVAEDREKKTIAVNEARFCKEHKDS